MDFSSLEIFCAVAEEGSITKAAQRLGRVQSNVTTRVQQLEQQLQAALFQREGRRMVLTAEGERFIGYAQRLLSLAQEAVQSVATPEPAGQLKIGSMEATAASRLPAPLARLHKAWPSVQLSISTGTSAKLLDELGQHRIDCALVALARGEEAALLAEHLTGVPIWTEQLMLLQPKEHDGRQALNLAAFEQGCSYRAVGEAHCREQAGRAPHVTQAGSYHAIMASVAAGGCVAVMPQSVLEMHKGASQKFSARPLQEMDTWLVWRRNFKSAALEALRQACAA